MNKQNETYKILDKRRSEPSKKSPKSHGKKKICT